MRRGARGRDPAQRAARRAQAYYRALARRERVLAGIRALTEGVALGLLDDDDLTEIDRQFFLSKSEVAAGEEHDYRSEGWNSSGLFAWEQDAVDRWFPATGRLLVTGAGGGREVLALLQQGYDVHGMEPNRALVEAGNDLLTRAGYEARLDIQPREGLHLGSSRYDGVIVGWGSYMLIRDRTARRAFLDGLAGSLREDGPVLLSFWLQQDRAGTRLTVVHRTADALRRLRRAPHVMRGDLLEPNFTHLFDPMEIEAELAASGLRLVALNGQPYGHAVALRSPR